MVVKKYLCAAPRPESWDDKAEALLKSLGGDEKKREKVLRQALQQLREVYQHERRTGPGRKSNAEHAIAFYEYVLGEGSEHEMEDEEDNLEEESKQGTVESMDSQEFLNQHNDLCDVCNLGGELLCCSTCNLVFHLDCVRPTLAELPQGDWSCSHCIISGAQGHKRHSKAWKTAAAAVRQMGRLRRSKQREDANKNTSSSSSEGEEEEEDVDVNPSGAETEIHQNKSETPDQSAIASEDEPAPEKDAVSKSPAKDEDSKDESDGEETKSSDKGKRNLELFKISDGLSPNMKLDSSVPKSTPTPTSARARRPRRQPTLYDPQICPDSRWQSDERAEWLIKEAPTGKSGGDEGEVAKEGKPPETPKTREAESSDKQTSDGLEEEDSPLVPKAKRELDEDGKPVESKFYWCNFCRDDPGISVCVFCACRICFGKHEREKLLLCDKCDDEYHTFCLSPPLETVPVSKRWFCPTCNPESTPRAKVGTRRAPQITTTPKASNASETTNTRTSPSKKDRKSPGATTPDTGSTSTPTSTGRPRGRPPKNKSPPSLVAPSSAPRKRGRPPKSASPPVLSPSPSLETPSPRKRGRPPKSASLSPTSKKSKTSPKAGGSDSGKKRVPSPEKRRVDSASKKPKTDPTTIPVKRKDEEPEEDPGTDMEPIKTSRSGRVVKRNSFHDEVEEGEQHLRAVRREEAEARKAGQQNEATEEDTDNVEGVDERQEDTTEDGGTAGEETVETEEDEHGGTAADSNDTDEMVDEEIEDVLPELPVRTKVVELPTTLKPDPPPLPPPPPPREPSPSPPPPPPIEVPPPAPPPVVVVPPAKVEEKPVVLATPEPIKIPEASKPPEEKKIVVVAMAPKPVAQVPEKRVAIPPVPAPVPPTPLAPAKDPAPQPKPSPPKLPPNIDVKALVRDAVANMPTEDEEEKSSGPVKVPRRKPGARECMQISRRFGVRVIPKKYMDTLFDYCTRGKVEHLIRMRERLDEHSRFLEAQLAGLEAVIREKGESDVVVPPLPERQESSRPVPSGTPTPATSTAPTTSTPAAATNSVPGAAPTLPPAPTVAPTAATVAKKAVPGVTRAPASTTIPQTTKLPVSAVGKPPSVMSTTNPTVANPAKELPTPSAKQVAASKAPTHGQSAKLTPVAKVLPGSVNPVAAGGSLPPSTKSVAVTKALSTAVRPGATGNVIPQATRPSVTTKALPTTAKPIVATTTPPASAKTVAAVKELPAAGKAPPTAAKPVPTTKPIPSVKTLPAASKSTNVAKTLPAAAKPTTTVKAPPPAAIPGTTAKALSAAKALGAPAKSTAPAQPVPRISASTQASKAGSVAPKPAATPVSAPTHPKVVQPKVASGVAPSPAATKVGAPTKMAVGAPTKVAVGAPTKVAVGAPTKVAAPPIVNTAAQKTVAHVTKPKAASGSVTKKTGP